MTDPIITRSLDCIAYISSKTNESYELKFEANGSNYYEVPFTEEVHELHENYKKETKKGLNGYLPVNFPVLKHWVRHYLNKVNNTKRERKEQGL